MPSSSSLSFSVAAACVATASGFSVQPMAAPAAPSAVRSAVRCMSEDQASALSAATSRRAALFGLLGVGLGSCANVANAGYVTSLGIETTKPADADVDDELLGSGKVQDALKALRGCKAAALALKGSFTADTNMQLIPVIRKEFDFSVVRDSLNVASTVFDDTTQATVDRIARSILYDLTELEAASRFKKGDPERTPKKVAGVDKWFVKLDADFTTFLSYYK